MVQDLQDAIELIVDVYEQHVPPVERLHSPIRGRSGSRGFRDPETEAARSQCERAVWVTSRGGWLVREDLVHALGVENLLPPCVQLPLGGARKVLGVKAGQILLAEREAVLEQLAQELTLALQQPFAAELIGGSHGDLLDLWLEGRAHDVEHALRLG